jgi:hypothetical protein
MVLDVARLLHETTEGSLCIGASRVKEDAEALSFCVRVYPFSDGAGWKTVRSASGRGACGY